MPGMINFSHHHITQHQYQEPLPTIAESTAEELGPINDLEGIICNIIDHDFDKFTPPRISIEPVMYFILTSQYDNETKKNLFYYAIETFAMHEKRDFVEILFEHAQDLNINWFTDIPLIFHELKGYYLCDIESRTPLFQECIHHNKFFLPAVIQHAKAINDTSGLKEILQQFI